MSGQSESVRLTSVYEGLRMSRRGGEGRGGDSMVGVLVHFLHVWSIFHFRLLELRRNIVREISRIKSCYIMGGGN